MEELGEIWLSRRKPTKGRMCQMMLIASFKKGHAQEQSE